MEPVQFKGGESNRDTAHRHSLLASLTRIITIIIMEEYSNRKLRNTVSDVSQQIVRARFLRDEDDDDNNNNIEDQPNLNPTATPAAAGTKSSPAKVTPTEEAECDCCGMKEEYTSNYIGQVKSHHSGRWVCGLCSEAVKENLNRLILSSTDDRKSMMAAMREEALSEHRRFCEEFNATVRVNPKLSLAWTLKDIAKRSHNHRRSQEGGSKLSGISRTTSCVPRIN